MSFYTKWHFNTCTFRQRGVFKHLEVRKYHFFRQRGVFKHPKPPPPPGTRMVPLASHSVVARICQWEAKLKEQSDRARGGCDGGSRGILKTDFIFFFFFFCTLNAIFSGS